MIFTHPRNALFAVLMTILFCSCKKNNDEIPPNDIIETKSTAPIPISLQVNEVYGGYYIQLPEHYSKTTKLYPIILFLHGLGQMGNGTTDLGNILNDGIGSLLNKGKFPPDFVVGGTHHSFIVVSPQASRQPHTVEVAEFIGYLKKTYRVDDKRFYIAGLSAGARLTTLLGAQYPTAIAAIVPIAGVATNSGVEERCESIAKNNLPVWALSNVDDPLANIQDVQHFVEVINGFNPTPLPKLTVFNVYGHDAWTTALNPEYKENGMNIYEWMLQYSR